MSATLRALLGHFVLTLRLNFRSPAPIIYGYVAPLLFLLAFASVFRGETPPVLFHFGQLLTLTALGGACFGLPTAIVSERERGVWRRYQLLPVGTASLLLSALLARIALVASAGAMQVVLAHTVFGAPWPLHLGAFAIGFVFVTTCFLGLGLLIAAIASDVPAVQALGQCIFLPMIMIGGVGVPLGLLPAWAQRAAAFMPGRYAVEILQLSASETKGWSGAGFSFLALAVIGAAAAIAGIKLFRWENNRRLTRASSVWIGAALAAWVAVGAAAQVTGNERSLVSSNGGYLSVTPEQIASITYTDMPGDNELYTRLAPPFKTREHPGRLGEIAERLQTWPPAQVSDPEQRARNLLSVAAIGDVNADLLEAEIARLVFDRLQETTPPDALKKVLTRIILAPDQGTVVSAAPEFGFKHPIREDVVRERNFYYAKKLLGRLVGKIQD